MPRRAAPIFVCAATLAAVLLAACAAPTRVAAKPPKPTAATPAHKASADPVIALPDSAHWPAGIGPQFFLSWGRPWGDPAAMQSRRPACGDTTRADTLYLCFRSGVDIPGFAAFTAEITVHAERPETLGTYWHFERGAPNQSGVAVRFQPEEGDTAWVQPWRSNGNGGVGYLRTKTAGRLRMIYAVEPKKAVPLQGNLVYTFARIAVKARASGLSGCEQGIALELTQATIAADSLREFSVNKGGWRYATSGARGMTALARLWHVDEQTARWRLRRVEPGERWPPPQ